MDQPAVNLIIGGIFTVLWFLLRQKDANQAKQIDLLFSKHDEDVAKLDALKLEIAQKHYIKNELDAKFEKMEATFERGFRDLGGKFDRLSEVLIGLESKK